jgi:hypothetical protein
VPASGAESQYHTVSPDTTRALATEAARRLLRMP